MGIISKINRVLFSTWDILGWWSQDGLTHVDTTNQVCSQIGVFFVGKFIELDDGTIYRKALYLMVKTMVSCRFSLKPIQWEILGNDTFGWGRAPLSEQVLNWLWRHQHRRQANPFPLPGWVSLFSVLLQGIKCKRMALYSVYWWLYHYIRLIHICLMVKSY